MNLQSLAQEYRAGAALIELRVIQLQYRLDHTRQQEVRRRLRHRIGALRVMMGESRRMGYDLDHYYDRPAAGN